MQIFVCGMHRSGTSVIARLLNMLGIYFGPEGSGLAANAENPKGFWERADIVALNDAILSDSHACWFDPLTWFTEPRTVRATRASEVRARLLELDGHRPWFIKDPRLCLTLGAWLAQAERPLAVVCSRDEASVVASLEKHGASLGFRFERREAEALVDVYNRSLLREVAAIPSVHVRYEDAIASPMSVVEKLHDALRDAGVVGLRMPDRREVEAFIDPGLQRHAAPEAGSPSALGLALRGESADPAVMSIPRESLDTLARLKQRVLRLDQVAGSGLQDSAAIAAIQRHFDGLPSVAGDDSPWSLSRLKTLIYGTGDRE